MSGEVAIVYPHDGVVKEAFLQSLLRLVRYDDYNRRLLGSNALDLPVMGQKGHYIEDNRNALVERVLARGSEWMLSLDTDHEFEPTILYKLIDSVSQNPTASRYPLLIVSGLYFGYFNLGPLVAGGDGLALRPMWFKLDAQKNYVPLEYYHAGLQIVDGIGMGCVLIHRSVLEAFPDNHDSWRWFGRDLNGRHRMLEDFTFCQRAQKLGYEIWANAEVSLGHEKARIVGAHQFFKQDLQEINQVN